MLESNMKQRKLTSASSGAKQTLMFFKIHVQLLNFTIHGLNPLTEFSSPRHKEMKIIFGNEFNVLKKVCSPQQDYWQKRGKSFSVNEHG